LSRTSTSSLQKAETPPASDTTSKHAADIPASLDASPSGAEPDTTAVRELMARLADAGGVTLSAPLKPHEVSRLKKPAPSYVSVVDDAARRLAKDKNRLHLTTVTPQQLIELHARRTDMAARETAAYRVYRSAYEQRMQVDDEALGKLLLIERRMNTMAEEDPSLLDDWKFMTDFLAEFRRKGGSATVAPVDEPPAEEPAPAAAPSVTLDVTARQTNR
jgi:hypothetical protein